MDYSKLSDFEINKMVADRMGYKAITCEQETSEELIVVQTDEGIRLFDPCNTPNDAWPIILKTRAELGNQKFKWYMRKRPLRVAMIIFLMSKERK
jgi:hypothetical protein